MLAISMLNFCQHRSAADSYNLIFISMDTTRFDFVDTGNGARASTPALKEFSKNAAVFKKAYCTIPETLPSHLSIFTSYSPHQLGVIHNHSRYHNKYPLIQEILKENRYHTYGVISLMSLVEPGFWKGFDEFNRDLCTREIEYLFVTADKVSEEARKKLDTIKKKKFFMFVHFSDPHYPYGPPNMKATLNVYLDDEKIAQLNPYRGMILPRRTLNTGTHRLRFEMETGSNDFKGLGIIELTKGIEITARSPKIEFRKDIFAGCHFMEGDTAWMNLECPSQQDIHLQILPKLKPESAEKMYQKEVEYMDEHLGYFIQHIKNQGLMKNTIVVIFSDHGEGLGERDNYFGHVKYVNQQFIRVPLLIFIPGKSGQVIDTPVSLSGLSSTVLELLKITSPTFSHSFLACLQQGEMAEKSIYSFSYQNSDQGNKISFIKWPFQGIFNWIDSDQSSELYDLELNDSFSEEFQIGQSDLSQNARLFFSIFMKQSLEKKRKIELTKPAGRNIDRQRIKNLKALGYLN